MRRHYYQARTLFDRLCAATILPRAKQEELTQWRDQINPRQLRRSIYEQRDQLFRVPGATPRVTEDVYATLMESMPA